VADVAEQALLVGAAPQGLRFSHASAYLLVLLDLVVVRPRSDLSCLYVTVRPRPGHEADGSAALRPGEVALVWRPEGPRLPRA
jgi:hypothetical protein